MKAVLKKILLILAIILGAILLGAVALFTYLTITEFRPEPEEAVAVENDQSQSLEAQQITLVSWNVGYGALGKESDFFMDGGTEVRPGSRSTVEKNLAGIESLIRSTTADFFLLQEVDSGSKRSYSLDEKTQLSGAGAWTSSYALNFSCNYVPYPFPTIGKVRSGLLTLSRYHVEEATRISLPCPFSWPVSMANLKRCLLVNRIPVKGQNRELVLVNLHLEAYDDGEGKLAQSQQLREFLEAEYQKGNYVVAGGDWNQIFPESEKTWPNTHVDLWTPGYLDPKELGSGWQYVWDETVPTCRLLNQPYDPADTQRTQYYVIDGFLVSPNLEVAAVQTLDMGFAYSDHNPVQLTLNLGD